MPRTIKIFISGDLGPVFLGAWVWMEEHCGLPGWWWEGQGFPGHSGCKLDTDSWLRPAPVWKSPSNQPDLLTEGMEIGNWKLSASSRCVTCGDEIAFCLIAFPFSKKTSQVDHLHQNLRTNNPFSVQHFFSKQLSCKEKKKFVLSGYSTECIFIYLSLVAHSEFIPIL